MMLRTLLHLLFMLWLSGCALKPHTSKPDFCGPPPYSDWMQHALAYPDENARFLRFALAYHGDPATLHAYFSTALKLKQAKICNCEHEEAHGFELMTIIHHVGDTCFSNALVLETPRVRSAVAYWMHLPCLSAYPMTLKLLAERAVPAARQDLPKPTPSSNLRETHPNQ